MRRLILLAAVLVGACDDGGGDETCAFGECGAGWHVAREAEDGALVSVWAASADEAWAVGGPLGNGGRGLVLHFVDGAWNVVDPGGPESLWWVWGTGADDVFFVGERGAILHWGGDVLTRYEPVTNATLFGVWGSSGRDVWAVGGSPSDPGGPQDVLLHYDGTGWQAVDVPAPRDVTFFKVWGSGADDVWIAAQRGLVLHRTASGFEWLAVPGDAHPPLFTVSGRSPDDVWVVGGPPASVFRWDAAARAFAAVTLPGDAQVLNGVSVAPDGTVWVVGMNGVKWRRAPDGTWTDDRREDPRRDLHGVWAGDGAAIVAGGDFVAPPTAGQPRSGVLGVFVGQ